MKTIVVAAAIAVTATTTAFAGTALIDKRQNNQVNRIVDGINSLTRVGLSVRLARP